MITMGVGVMYLWGIISIYAASYYRIVTNDSTFTSEKADIVFPLQLLGQVFSHLSRLFQYPLLLECLEDLILDLYVWYVVELCLQLSICHLTVAAIQLLLECMVSWLVLSLDLFTFILLLIAILSTLTEDQPLAGSLLVHLELERSYSHIWLTTQ